MLFLALISFGVLLLGGGAPPAGVLAVGWAGAAGLVVISLGLAGLMIPPLRCFGLSLASRLAADRLKEPLEGMVQAYLAGKRMIAAACLSVLGQLFLLAPFVLAGMALGIDLGWQAVFLVVPLIFVANSVPVFPGGIGGGETAAAFLFAQFGLAEGAAVMMVVRIWLAMVQMTGGVIYLMHRGQKAQTQSDTDSL